MMKNKKSSPLPSIVRVVGIIFIICCFSSLNGNKTRKLSKNAPKKVKIVQNSIKSDKKNTKKVQKIEIAPAYYEEPVVEEVEENNNKIENIVESNEESNNEIQSIVDISYTTRMTSYYPKESSDCTGSGLCKWDFETNEFGWFTYQGKLVVATATMYLLNEGFTLYDGVHTYRYYDEITLNIDGVDYQAIVLDSCGSSMKTDRIDLFVSGSWAVKDIMIEVKE